MNVSLTQQLEKFINKQVTSGRYQTASEVIRQGLRMMQEREREQSRRLEDLRREIRVGLDAIERGDYGPFDPEKIKAEGRRLLAQRKKKRA